MKDCKVSIILPVYNTAKYLEDCMDSLINQSLKEIEIIAVNDGSTDNSLEILKSYQARYPEKVYVYNTENHGVSSARNFGIEKACGEYIWFVDSDDYTEPDACQRLYDKVIRDNNDLVLFSRYDVDGTTGEKTANKTFHFNQNFKACNKAYEMVKLSPFPWNKFIKKELLEGVRFPVGIRFEDLPISFILFSRAKSVGVINDYLYDYRVQVGFLSKFTESTLDIVKAVEFLRSTLESDGTLSLYADEVEYITIRHFCYRFEQLLTLSSAEDYSLKIKLINTLFDYLEEKYPNRDNNPYLIYNLPDRIYRLYDFYSSKEKLTEYVESTKDMTFEEQTVYNAELTEKYSPAEKAAKPFDEIKEKNKEKSLLFNTIQRNESVNNSAVFVSNSNNGISSSLLSFLVYISKNSPDTVTAVACGKNNKEKAKKILNSYGLESTKVFKRGGENYVKFTATAKYIFADCPLEHFFKTADGQTYINVMTEHIAPKELYRRNGNDFAFSAVQKSLMTADVTLYNNESGKAVFEQKYRVSGLGVKSACVENPSADLAGISDIKKALSIESKKILMLVPKYKAGEDRTAIKAYRKFMASLIQLDREMADDEVAVLCLDDIPFDADMNIFTHIILLPEEYSLYDLAGSADVIATNYHQLLKSSDSFGAKTVRYITDEKRYITNEELEVNEGDFPVFIDSLALAEYLHNAQKIDEKEADTNASKKIFDLINDLSSVKAEESEEANVLYFLGGKLTENRIRTFKRLERENPVKRYFIAFDEGKNSDYGDELLGQFRGKNYIPLRFDTTSCFGDKEITSICSKGRAPLFGKDKLDDDRKREWKKYFGSIHFDEIIILSVGEIERNLMFIGAAPQLSYSFNWFGIDKYNNKKAFRCKVDYICKELEGAQRVVISEEMQGLKCIKDLNIAENLSE